MVAAARIARRVSASARHRRTHRRVGAFGALAGATCERERLSLASRDVPFAPTRLCSVCFEHDVESGLHPDAATTRAKRITAPSHIQTSALEPIGRYPGLSGGASRCDIDYRTKWVAWRRRQPSKAMDDAPGDSLIELTRRTDEKTGGPPDRCGAYGSAGERLVLR